MDSSVFDKYGQAYASLASDPKSAIEEIESLQEALKSNPDFIALLGSPNISKDTKKEMIDKIIPDASITLVNFLDVIVDNSRGGHVVEILDAALVHLYDREGIKRGYIFVSFEITSAQLKKIEKSLGQRLGYEVRLKVRIDNSLIGGIKIAIEDKVYDASLKKKLSDLKLNLLGGL